MDAKQKQRDEDFALSIQKHREEVEVKEKAFAARNDEFAKREEDLRDKEATVQKQYEEKAKELKSKEADVEELLRRAKVDKTDAKEERDAAAAMRADAEAYLSRMKSDSILAKESKDAMIVEKRRLKRTCGKRYRRSRVIFVSKRESGRKKLKRKGATQKRGCVRWREMYATGWLRKNSKQRAKQHSLMSEFV